MTEPVTAPLYVAAPRVLLDATAALDAHRRASRPSRSPAPPRCSSGRPHRLKPKDAGDVLRLMRAEGPGQVGRRLRELAADPIAGPSVSEGVDHLRRLFGRPRASGVEQAVQALAGALPEESVRGLAVAYTEALIGAYEGG